MDVIMECCCGLDIHRDVVEACIIKGTLDTPDKIQRQFKTTRRTRVHANRPPCPYAFLTQCFSTIPLIGSSKLL